MQKSNLKAGGRAIVLVLTYFLIGRAARLTFMTISTYFYIQGSGNLNEIGDLVRANAVLIYGVSSGIFAAVLKLFYPITTTSVQDILGTNNKSSLFERNSPFFVGLARGMTLGAALIAGTLLGGHLNYLGFYTKIDELLLSFVSITFFTISIIAISLVEEFLIRVNLEREASTHFGPFVGILSSLLVFLFIKYFQFNLELVSFCNLGILSILLSQLARKYNSHLAPAGFLTGCFFVLHALCSLPLFGQDVSGLFLLRTSSETGVGAYLSGGFSGPENGIVFTLLLLLMIIWR